MMWLDELKPGESWMGVWRLKFTCGNCTCIIDSIHCPLCGYEHKPVQFPDATRGNISSEPVITLAGAIPYNTYVILELMKREWERPLVEDHEITGMNGEKIPQRIIIVLLFWTLFESQMESLFSKKLKTIPEKIANNLLKRYSTISSRLGEFYKLVFDATFEDDLKELGYHHLFNHIKKIQQKRNEFIHDNPMAIDDVLVLETVTYLQAVQEAWIAIYNKRCTSMFRDA